jgi:branched-chain amino acid aminotransferase/4-amino-4-deoxychorismate lyase
VVWREHLGVSGPFEIPPDDRGFALGHGVFETVLWEGHRLGHWEAHLARLAHGAQALGLPPPDPAACRNAVEVALKAADYPARAAVRLNWSAGAGGRGLDPPEPLRPQLTASAARSEPAVGPLRLAVAATRRNELSPASRLKTLAYLDNVLARGEARAAGADEALMLNSRGEVACAAAANIFWIKDEGVCTPALACGVLDGIMRAEVRAACARLRIGFSEVRAGIGALRGAPAFITNSLIGVREVSRLDGHALPRSSVTALLAGTVNPGR